MNNTVKKNVTAKLGDKYSYKYTDLAQVNKALYEMGITYYQYFENYNGFDYVMTVPIINGEEKPPRRGCRLVDAELRGLTNPVMQYGSAITFCRRYSLLMAFGLATEDTDAAEFTKEKKASENQVKSIQRNCTDETCELICKKYGVEHLEDLTMNQASEVIGNFKNGRVY